VQVLLRVWASRTFYGTAPGLLLAISRKGPCFGGHARFQRGVGGGGVGVV